MLAKLLRNSLDLMGVFDGEYAFRGPDCVQIDLTNDCNNNCIACWCNSPLLGDKATPAHVKGQYLDHALTVRLIDKLSAMGTRELYFSGGGEPLMHPEALELVSYAKSKGFRCYLHTNFTLMDEEKINRIKTMGLDHLVISLWAATPETYVKTHPNKKEEDFERVIRLLTLLNRSKDGSPQVRIYNVISNINYREFASMLELCLETSSESVEFALVDTIPERTEKLLLSEEESRELLQACQAAQQEKEYYKEGKFIVSNFDQFLRRVQSQHGQSAEYDRGFLDKMPCYVGWLFARVLADGNVNSCLKSHRFPVGNLYKEEFDVIWNGARQRQFRQAVSGAKKDSRIFSLIGNDPQKTMGCYKSCDDLGRNMIMHDKIKRLGLAQRILLRAAAGVNHLCKGRLDNGRKK